MASVETLHERLEAIGQSHLLAHADELDDAGKARLAARIEAIDLDSVPQWIERYVRSSPGADFDASTIQPAPFFAAEGNDADRSWDRDGATELGESLLKAGAMACFLVAGGQGTRLGFDGPKGCFPAGAVTGKPLFAIFAEGIQAAERRYSTTIPWYIMTSPLNHEPTLAFFKDNHHFGLDPANVTFFPQGVMPSFDAETGKILLADKDEPATNPDGHGGAITALHKSGALDDMKSRGIQHISYFQVDNPLVRVADSTFLGLHAGDVSSGEMSSKMLPKAYPEERVGVFCLADGKVCMVEYSDMTSEQQNERTMEGALRFIAGNPAIHMLGVPFVERLATDPAFELPFHRAVKKIPHLNADGERVEPDAPNGIKLERFIFDALPLAERSIIMETERVEEFAPIKNAEGNDSPESSKRIQTIRAASWLRRQGVDIPYDDDGMPDCTLEISPLTASQPGDLARSDRAGSDLPKSIAPGQSLAL